MMREEIQSLVPKPEIKKFRSVSCVCFLFNVIKHHDSRAQLGLFLMETFWDGHVGY